MKLSNIFRKKHLQTKEEKMHREQVRQSTTFILKKYDKTFRDLARYDKGEEPFEDEVFVQG